MHIEKGTFDVAAKDIAPMYFHNMTITMGLEKVKQSSILTYNMIRGVNLN